MTTSRFPRRLLAAPFAALVAVSPAAFAQADESLPEIFFDVDPYYVAEGDSGTTPVTVSWSIAAQTHEVSFFYSVPDSQNTPGQAPDVIAVPPTAVTIAPGQTGGSFVAEIVGDLLVENDTHLRVRFTDIVGARVNGLETEAEVTAMVDDDDEPAPKPWIARNDQFRVFPNAQPGQADLAVLSNDTYEWESMQEATLTLRGGPSHGTAQVQGLAISYVPEADYIGDDRIEYRVCRADGQCRDRAADIEVAPWPVGLSGHGRSDRDNLALWGLPEMTAAEYLPTPLVPTQSLSLDLTPDMTPATPWDSDDGVAFATGVIAASDEPIAHRFAVGFNGNGVGIDVDLYVGLDTDGDGRPSADEVLCTDGESGNADCEIRFEQGATAGRWWVMAHNRTQNYAWREALANDVAIVDGDGSLVVTGPGHAERLASVNAHASWEDPTFLPEQSRHAYLRVVTGAGATPIMVPVSISADYTVEEQGLPLRAGEARTISLAAGASHDRLWLDVPAGATRLTVTSASDSEVDFYVARQTAAIDARDAVVPAAPGIAAAAGVADGAGGDGTVVVEGGALAPGHWYVVPTNTGDTVADVVLSYEIEAVAPVVRSGSYFNEARPGSGLFLYPAGDQWTGLWYTYRDFGFVLPDIATWYYLQAAAPGVDGIWRSPIWRGTWNGTTRTLTIVGEATVTPTGPDQFLFSYMLEGRAGSQPLAGLGRGCPTFGGSALDISSQWFDPAHAGTGYSVQMFPDYEYYAAYVYDHNGEPLFLAAESDTFAGAEATLDLQLLTGACPTCGHQTSLPWRDDVGVLTRRIGAGTLQQIEVDAIFEDIVGVPGASWSAVDDVVPLGGPTSMQGCEL